MSSEAINIAEKFTKFDATWSPRNIAALNDYVFKLAKFEGDFVWHSHPETDEVFLVMAGEIGIEFRDKTVMIKAGEMYVVPKGVEHKPFAPKLAHVMLIEPKETINTGDAGGDRTADHTAWI